MCTTGSVAITSFLAARAWIRSESTTLGYWQGVGFPGTVRVYEVRIR